MHRTTEGRLAEKVAIVTGSQGALGRSITAVLRRHGATVVGVDIAGDDCVLADISSERDNRRVVEETVGLYGRLDIVALNAGAQHMAPIDEFPLEKWRQLTDVMMTGPFLMMAAAWPHLAASGQGRVIATASTSSFVAEKYKAAYVAAKHGLLGLVKVAALEGADKGITVNAVAPSWMRTAMVENQVAERGRLLGKSADEVVADLVQEQAVKRFVEPEEVAETLAFLASPQAAAITGACVPVDLGALA
jgi:3-hydroxybutyrate dehydrogenase